MKGRQLTSSSSSPFLRRSNGRRSFGSSSQDELCRQCQYCISAIIRIIEENFFVTFLKHKKELLVKKSIFFHHVQDKKHYHFNGVFMVSRRFDHFQIFFIELCQTAWKQSSYKLLINAGVGFWNCSVIATRALSLIKRNF